MNRRSILPLLLMIPIAVFAVGGVVAVDPAAEATRTDVIMLVMYISLAIVFSFLCSVAEAVLLSLTPSYVAGLAKTGSKTGLRLKALKENVDRPLAAILTLNTVAHTMGAIGSGTKAAVVFGSSWAGVFSVVMTLAVLFISEIIPKTLGAVYWRNLAGVTAGFIRVLIVSMYPLIWVSERLTKLVAGGREVHAFSRDEFKALADIGAAEGKIAEQESNILTNLFRFESLTAADIMTPRTVMVSLPASARVDEILPELEKSPFSRFPVYGESRDQMQGFVLRNDVLLAGAKAENDVLLSTLSRSLEHVSQDLVLSKVLAFLLNHKAQLALVVDQYGGTVGLVTLEDVVETLLGLEIVDEVDTVEDMQALARRKWKARAAKLGLKEDALDLTEE